MNQTSKDISNGIVLGVFKCVGIFFLIVVVLVAIQMQPSKFEREQDKHWKQFPCHPNGAYPKLALCTGSFPWKHGTNVWYQKYNGAGGGWKCKGCGSRSF